MTSVQMLERLRTLLDEASAGFWSDDQCYEALSDGQEEYTAIVLAQYKARAIVNVSEPIPEILRTLYSKASLLLSDVSIDLPANFLYGISVYLGGTYNRPLMKRELSKTIVFDQQNSLMNPLGYYYYITNNKMIFEISTPTSLACTIEFLIKPTDITSSINPVLPEYTHFSMIIYAYAQLLRKAQRLQEASTQYQEFISTVKYL